MREQRWETKHDSNHCILKIKSEQAKQFIRFGRNIYVNLLSHALEVLQDVLQNLNLQLAFIRRIIFLTKEFLILCDVTLRSVLDFTHNNLINRWVFFNIVREITLTFFVILFLGVWFFILTCLIFLSIYNLYT